MNLLAYWINERYSIKLKRDEGLPPPWSDDPIFQTVRFCNVHREDDKVTKWIRECWNRGDDPAWKFVLGRMINLPESLEKLIRLGDELSLKELKEVLKFRMDVAGQKVFTSAYTISTCGKKMEKLDYVFDYVVQAVMEAGEPEYGSCLEAYSQLKHIDGLGSFLAAQVIADMKNTKGHPLENAPDWWDFSAPGPGSLRGLSWYFFNSDKGVTGNTYQMYLNRIRHEVDPLIDKRVPRISNQDFQNCLCEFSKWSKVKFLNGHVRNRVSYA